MATQNDTEPIANAGPAIIDLTEDEEIISDLSEDEEVIINLPQSKPIIIDFIEYDEITAVQVVCDQDPLMRGPAEGSGRANKPPASEFFAYAPDSLDVATKTIRKNMMGVVIGTMEVKLAIGPGVLEIAVGMFPQPEGEVVLKPAWNFADKGWGLDYDALQLSIFADGGGHARLFKPLKTTDGFDLDILRVISRGLRKPREGEIGLRPTWYRIYTTQGGWCGVKAAARRVTMAREAGEWVLQNAELMVSKHIYGPVRQLADWSEV